MPLRAWKCNAHVILGKLENLVDKAAKIKEELKLMSVVIDWLEQTMSKLLHLAT